MKRLGTLITIASLVATLGAATAASAADLCLQFDGLSCDLSGDTGFFRFMGAKFPKNNKKAVALHGRVCGTGSATGTLVMSSDSTSIHLSATFNCDSTPGLIVSDFNPANTAINSTGNNGAASFGTFETNNGCTVTIVDCTTEP